MATELDDAEFNVSHYVDILMRRRWIVLATFTIVFVSVLFWTYTTRPIFQSSALIVIEKERGSSNVTSDGTMTESNNADYYQTQYKLLKSVTLLRQVYEKVGLAQNEDFGQPRGVQKLGGAVAIVPVVRSRLVNINVSSHDPFMAAQIANAIAQTFVEQNLANQLFISKDVLQALQVNNDDAMSRKNYESLPAVVNNVLIQQLKADSARIQAQLADSSAKFMPKHPQMLALKANLGALQAQIGAETEKIVQSLKTELSGQLKGNNVRIIDAAAVPEFPVKPNKRLMTILGIVAGLSLGLGFAFLIELLDQSIRVQEDVEQKLGLPFLGMIPLANVSKGTVYQPLLTKELSLTSEALRNVRTMVDFASVSQNSKAILMTSTVQAEGKSYVASNLAVAFSQLDERVLLIAGDLRRPSVHKLFSLPSDRGLSDFLAKGQRVEELGDLVVKTNIPNVTVLPCGPRPPNPSELLNTPRLGALIAWAKSNYDRVIIDCTPMYPIHDTMLWGRHVNSALYVVRYGGTRAPLVAKACERLRNGGVKILGAVINAAKARGLTYSSYGYYYQQYYHAYEQEPAAPSA